MGIMSGTSCDGLDMVTCRWVGESEYTILDFESAPWPDDFRQKLEGAIHLSGRGLAALENEFTQRSALAINAFLSSTSAQPAYMGVHGHTVFHEPDQGLTTQMLNGGMLAALTGVPVVCDFRRQDVALDGQGAPLVPIGDRLLFSNYDACINIGGFANVAFNRHPSLSAFDICPANIALNGLANRMGFSYDRGGLMASQGKLDPVMMQTLMSQAYFKVPAPKSLGREWYEAEYGPILSAYPDVKNALATAVEAIAHLIAQALNPLPENAEVLLTGGGAYNTYLVSRIRAKTKCTVSIPDPLLVEAKEALIFALLARLRLAQKTNTLPEVTGARRAVSAGAIYLP